MERLDGERLVGACAVAVGLGAADLVGGVGDAEDVVDRGLRADAERGPAVVIGGVRLAIGDEDQRIDVGVRQRAGGDRSSSPSIAGRCRRLVPPPVTVNSI